MKILVVCQYYYPESFKVTDVCEELSKRGHEVTVLTGRPNYPTGIVPEEYKGDAHSDEVVNGVRVIRCYERGRGKGAVNLAINYASFYFSAMKMVRKMDKDFDIVFSYQLSPVFMALPARWYKNHRHVPMFLYCSDLWPESMKVYLKSESNPVFKWVKNVSKKVYDSADRIATQSDIFVDYLEEVHGINNNKLKYIPNFADEGYLSADFTPDDDTVDFMFMGNIGVAQNVEQVMNCYIEAYNRIKKNNIKTLSGQDIRLKFHVVGGGVKLDDVKKIANAIPNENADIKDSIVFYGQRPENEMPDFYKKADVCIVSLKADNKIGLTLPAKVQGYMAAGKTILGMIDGSCQNVISEAKCGMCVGASEESPMIDAIVELSKNPEEFSHYGNNSRAYFLKNFRKDIHVDAIEAQLTKCLKGE